MSLAIALLALMMQGADITQRELSEIEITMAIAATLIIVGAGISFKGR